MTKERVDKVMKDQPTSVKINSMYYTLGRYDFVIIAEASNEKASMAVLPQFGDHVAGETLIAVPRDEGHILLKL